jgi:hypothetical protein
MKRLSITRGLALRGKGRPGNSQRKYWFAGALLLAVFALASPFVAVRSQSGGFSVENDVDRGGSDYKDYEVSGGHEVCRDACASDARCVAYTYTRPWQGYSAKCWLKDRVPSPVPYRSCCISGVKGGGGAVGGNVREVNWNNYPSDQDFHLYGKVGVRVTVRCPPLPAGMGVERVIGTDIYTEDSRFCVAAVHSGLISTQSGGVVTIETLNPERYYTGSQRYGITTLSYDNSGVGYKASFRYIR